MAMAMLRSQNKNKIILMEWVWFTHSVTADVKRQTSVNVSDSYVITWVIWQSPLWCMQNRTWPMSRQKKTHMWSHPLECLPLRTGVSGISFPIQVSSFCFGFSTTGDHTDTHMFIAIVSYYFTLTYKWNDTVPFCFLGEFCMIWSKYSVTLISTGYF